MKFFPPPPPGGPLHFHKHAHNSQILFLNKVDLFREKILNSDRHLRLFFPQYTGEWEMFCSETQSSFTHISPPSHTHTHTPPPHTPLGPDREVDIAARFIQGEFLERNLTKSKIIYPHFTTATDTSNIKVVMKVVLDTIIRENLEAANLL